MSTREQIRAAILGADDRPEGVKRMEGHAGRKPKWTAAQFDDETRVAIQVEIERQNCGIPSSRIRTPEEIFEKVAAKLHVSPRSARRFYTQHRRHAREWAHYIAEAIPKHRAQSRELLSLYGPAIGNMPCTWLDHIYALREAAGPGDIPRFDSIVRSIIGQKQQKT